MKHRDADDSKQYRVLSKKFIEKYGVETTGYDVIRGWRANASYFYIAKEFVRDNIDMDILEEVLSLGGLGIQYCMKSEAAYAHLIENIDALHAVPYAEFNDKYNQRNITARKKCVPSSIPMPIRSQKYLALYFKGVRIIMRAYPEEYLNDVVENQGKLFDLVSQLYDECDTEAFIQDYMMSKTRKNIDEAQA